MADFFFSKVAAAPDICSATYVMLFRKRRSTISLGLLMVRLNIFGSWIFSGRKARNCNVQLSLALAPWDP
jgi:hypothetical protein